MLYLNGEFALHKDECGAVIDGMKLCNKAEKGMKGQYKV